ncbi:hypothetical protein HETIRDRAFT_414086 [Heterobasidion irregulare TC 32-1]|uniref:Reverse transcriptase domain-containing protein n=1 Tax=Heterobasidion irregulare (strain TC 32-1) TaxID=747525 RepID=W4KRW3_HETIT|nr:uncharacterized protein HETIRDRAFT_414086 [Heterobasidion irregulare TC 32-1]ETW87786.1 hypothetical protein HETIRDRAFT_414086 [Heterobasidion irregulare TC 32-1]
MEYPLRPKLYSLSPMEQEELKKFIDKSLKKGFIRESKSHMTSPFFFIKKKNRKLWPLLDLSIDVEYFSLVNINTGYNNILINEKDIHKAAFATNLEMYEPLVMYFGLTNSSATFQTMMNLFF